MNHQRAFIRCFEAFSPRHNRYQVMADFALLGATALHNSVAFSRELEDDYLRAAERYTLDELHHYAELLTIVVRALEAGSEDFLGQTFMALELGNERAGQFFSPWSVSKMMARISYGESLANLTEEFVTLSEPACGAGGMVVAFAEALREAGHNPQKQLWVQAWDIDPLPARLCFIQLALLHIPAEVVIGDTLRYEARQALRTPAHYLGLWDIKLRQRSQNQSVSQVEEGSTAPAFGNGPLIPLAADRQFRFEF